MIVNGKALYEAAPIQNMLSTKQRSNGVSHGLAEAGYDIRLKQDLFFHAHTWAGGPKISMEDKDDGQEATLPGRFTIASAVEYFHMPNFLVGVVHDKSTWARKGVSVFNTVIEPGFRGGLTLEIVFHGNEDIHIPAGSGIAQVLFTRIWEKASYSGKYQNQSSAPVKAIMEF